MDNAFDLEYLRNLLNTLESQIKIAEEETNLLLKIQDAQERKEHIFEGLRTLRKTVLVEERDVGNTPSATETVTDQKPHEIMGIINKSRTYDCKLHGAEIGITNPKPTLDTRLGQLISKDKYKTYREELGDLFINALEEPMEFEGADIRLDPTGRITECLEDLLETHELVDSSFPLTVTEMEHFRHDFEHNLVEFCWELLQIAQKHPDSSQTGHHLSEEQVFCAIMPSNTTTEAADSIADQLRNQMSCFFRIYRNYIMGADGWEDWNREEDDECDRYDNWIDESDLKTRIYGGMAAWQVACKFSSDPDLHRRQFGVKTFGLFGLAVLTESLAAYVDFMG